MIRSEVALNQEMDVPVATHKQPKRVAIEKGPIKLLW